MFTVGNDFSNPQQVNEAGGIILEHVSGEQFYIDSAHPQYDAVLNGDFGEVTQAIIDNSHEEAAGDQLSLDDIAAALAEIAEAVSISAPSPAMQKIQAKAAKISKPAT